MVDKRFQQGGSVCQYTVFKGTTLWLARSKVVLVGAEQGSFQSTHVFKLNVQSVRICHIIKGFPAKPAEKEKVKVDLGLTRLAVDRHLNRQIEQHARHLQSTILSKRKSNA